MAASGSTSSPPVAPLDLSKTAVQFPPWCEARGFGCKRLLSRSHFSTVWLVQAKNGELRVLKEMHVAAHCGMVQPSVNDVVYAFVYV